MLVSNFSYARKCYVVNRLRNLLICFYRFKLLLVHLRTNSVLGMAVTYTRRLLPDLILEVIIN